MKIGIIREGKVPNDSRVPLTPSHCKSIIDRGIDLVVQPSKHRCYSDDEYTALGIPLQKDLSDRDILLGVKEVPIDQLLPDKTYFFFSHTIKEQVYNRDLLKACVDQNIRLIDYEVLTNDNGARVIAFGKFAGMVGAHNALWTYAQRTRLFDLPRLKDLKDYNEAKELYKSLSLPPMNIVLTGTGRVAGGAAMVLNDMGIKKISPISFIKESSDIPVFAQLNSFYYVKRKDGETFDSPQDFYDNPKSYTSDFQHFLATSDIMINGIFWDNDAPAFFTKKDMKDPNFRIKVIADVTCDIAPVSSIPSTLEASTIADPVFGYDPMTEKKTAPYQEHSIDMMTIDNLPNELPRDASHAFGDMFMQYVFDELAKDESRILMRGSVAINGDLGPHFEYLRSYLNG